MRSAFRLAGLSLGIAGLAAACGNASFSGDDSSTADASTTDATAPTEASTPTPDSGVPSGTLTPLTQVPLAEGIFVDNDYVYYTSANYAAAIGEIGRISKTTLQKEVIANGEGPAMEVVTVDDDHVFWTEWDLGVDTTFGGVRTKRATTGSASTLITLKGPWFGTTAVGPADLIGAQFGGAAYTFNAMSTADAGVVAVPFTYGDGGPVASVQPSHYALDQGTLYWTDEDNDARGGVYSAAPNGGTVTQLTSDTLYAWGLAVNTNYIVYSTYNGDHLPNGGTIVRLDRNNPSNAKTLTNAYARIAGIAIAGAAVYFCDNIDTVWKVPLDGSSAPIAVVTGQAAPHSLATDGTALYWTNSDGVTGGVMRFQL